MRKVFLFVTAFSIDRFGSKITSKKSRQSAVLGDGSSTALQRTFNGVTLTPSRSKKGKRKKALRMLCLFMPFVRINGLEPLRLSPLDPKSSAATNYAISAWFSTLLMFSCFSK